MKLRKKKPYTCRMSVAGKICAAYLADDDGDYCKPHQQAVDKFAAGVKPEPVRELEVAIRRIWP